MPYIGYFQLIKAVDEFILYDNIEYTKKGWINRNRILMNNKAEYVTLPLKNDSDFLNVNQRYLSENSQKDIDKLLNKLNAAYRKAPYYSNTIGLLDSIFYYPEKNLFKFIENSLKQILIFLEIKTPIIISSSLPVDHTLKGKFKVIEICKNRRATSYVNPIGGIDLYDVNDFRENGIRLNFLSSRIKTYEQFNNEFIPWLSIIDIMMFNSPKEVNLMINNFELL